MTLGHLLPRVTLGFAPPLQETTAPELHGAKQSGLLTRAVLRWLLPLNGEEMQSALACCSE
jgi:hypothetical protein